MTDTNGDGNEPPVTGESRHEAVARRERNRNAREAAARWSSAICVKCGFTQGNVRHDVDPVDREWAGDSGYYDDFETHPFRGSGIERSEGGAG